MNIAFKTESPTQRKWPACRISIVSSQEELIAIGKLRYSLYVERDRKSYDANHLTRTFIEPIDNLSTHFQAFQADRLVGAVRLTDAIAARNDPHLRLLSDIASQFVELPDSFIASRLVILAEIGARTVIWPLFQAVHQTGIAAGGRYCVIATRKSLMSLFRRAGFKQLANSYLDPTAGTLYPLVLDAFDKNALSPIPEDAPDLTRAKHQSS